MFALAIDLGTTTLAASLIDIKTGTRLAITGSMNPQRKFGADVVSRLDAACTSEETLLEMSSLIRNELQRLARELCESTGVPWGEVKRIAIAGNPAMQHILLKLPVKSLAFPPYLPLLTGGRFLKAIDLDWVGHAEIFVFPMPGGFVGGDTVAFLYGAEPGEATLCLDMGTNGEMALVTGKTIWATSAAAGPAFEGGNLSCGMPALPGAINSVHLEDKRVKLTVIADTPPIGICGSAAIEIVSELLRHDIIESGGRLRDSLEISSNLATRVISVNGENAFVLYRDAARLLMITQSDVRQVQLAKAALRAGMEVLFERSCIRCEALKKVILTGSFGAVLQPEWLKNIGIFDTGMVQITRFTPEGALAGVERSLIASDGFVFVENMGERFRVVPLSGTPMFEKHFIQQINFPGNP